MLKLLAMAFAFADSCLCTELWFDGSEYDELQRTFLHAKDVSAVCLLSFSNQPFVRASD